MRPVPSRRRLVVVAGASLLVALLCVSLPGAVGAPNTSHIVPREPETSARGVALSLGSVEPVVHSTSIPIPAITPDEWQNATLGASPSGAPPAVAGASIAWDPADGELVLFGGGNALHPQNQTWVYSLGDWVNVTDYASAPPAEFGGALDYDYAFGAVLLFGGCGHVCPLAQTWSFLGGVWTNRTGFSFSTPPARYDASMAFVNDSSDESTVLFGGCVDAACSTRSNDTWAFNQTVGWVPVLGGPAPSPRDLAATAFSPGVRSLVLFGGCGRSGCGLNDTWLYHGGAWVNYSGVLRAAHNPSPPGVGAAQSTYDGAMAVVLLFGGSGRTGNSNQTWGLSCTLSACAWTNLTGASGSPPAINSGSEASESTTYAPVVFGGYCSCVAQYLASAQTWVDEPALTSAPALMPPTAPARTPILGSSNVAGGTAPYEFRWSAGSSTITTADANLSFSEPGSYAVHFSVFDRYGVGRATTLTEVATGPGANASVSATTAEVGESLSFSTPSASGGTAPYEYNWTFGDGNASTGPVVTHRYPAPGTFVATVVVSDALDLQNVSSVSVRIVALPSVSVGTFRSTVDLGGVVTFASAVTGGIAPYAFAWTFGSAGTSTAADPTFTFASTGRFEVNLTVTDANTETASASTTISVNPALSASATGPAEAQPAGSNVSFSVSATGGSLPLAYAWAFGDRTRSISETPVHVYQAAGNYTVRWWVNDSANGSTQGSILVSITPGPSGDTGGSGPGGGAGGSSAPPIWRSPELWIALGAVIFIAIGILSLFPPKRKSTPVSNPPS